MKMFKDSIKTITISLIFLALIGIAHAWTEPVGNPPTSNTSAPIVTGSASSPIEQVKYGNLTVQNNSSIGGVTIFGPLNGQQSASTLQLAATDNGAYWHMGFRGTASGELGNLSTWYWDGASWISPLKLTPLGDAIINRNVSIGGNANVCKKVPYTFSGVGTGQTTYCGANYYVVSVMESNGIMAYPSVSVIEDVWGNHTVTSNFPPSSGILICCKNAD